MTAPSSPGSQDSPQSASSAPSGRDSIPYRLERPTPAAEVVAAHGGLQDGEESGESVTVAGRLMLLRVQGKLAFGQLRDSSGHVQLFATAAVTDEFDAFRRLNLGDWIAATGEVVRTKRGELSVKVGAWSLLAPAMHGFGDKWRGVNDPEVRFRQREVDMWANEGVRDRFLMRSKIVSTIRDLMERRDFVEVETPVLQALYGGANAKPFVTHFNSMHADFYLRISLELYLKRLIVGGIERVFEMGRIFRNEGLSPKYNPEFTMLEAYQAYADYHDMAELVEYIAVGAAEAVHGGPRFSFQGRELDLTQPWRKATLLEVVAEQTGEELDLGMAVGELRRRADRLGVQTEEYWDAGTLVAQIYEKTTEPNLWGPVHVMDYPVAVSPLTRRHRAKEGFVERITPIVAGREIGECYSELIDPEDQRARFVAQAEAAAHGYDEAMVLDEDFLRALERGMPPTGGIGVGIDRLVMLLLDVSHIREVLLFPTLRQEAGRES